MTIFTLTGLSASGKTVLADFLSGINNLNFIFYYLWKLIIYFR